MKHARRFVAKILVLVMVFQGWPFFELSREYVYVFPKERVERLLEFITFLIEPAIAEAAPPRVVCVPQLPTDLLVPHETWSGKTTILKGVARDEDGNLPGGTYYWDFGDGGQSTPQAITNPDNLAATHTYDADPGTLFIATLHVTDAAGESSEDEYRVLVKDKTLDVEVNKAIDDGLWWLYTQREPVDVYVPIPQTNLVAPDGTPGLKGEYFNNTGMEGDPVLTRIDPVVDFDWGAGSPGSGVNQDRFSARWTGKLRITKPGPYKLAVASDDGVRLYINGQKVIDGWVVHGREWFCHEMNLDAGDHDIMLEFFEFRGSASIGLYWIIPGKEYWRWNNVWYSSTHFGNTTASAVQAFEINGHLETGDPDEDPYVDAVKGALSYLFSGLVSYTIGLQDGNNPDGNGNNIGISWSSNRPIYELGAVMDAIVATGTPDAITRTGGVNVLGRRYQDIVQDMVDMYAWGQGDSDNGGGWRYHWNDWPDNSASQWGAIGMIAAERHFGCIVPQWVKDRNDAWLTYSHDGVGFGYTDPGHGLAQTPSGMIQLSFDGKDITDSRWVASESYLAGVWDEFIRVDRDNRYYSYYAFAKAMRLALPQEVTHLSTGLDWYGDENKGLARVLVDQQNDDGSWPYDEWKVGEKTAAAWNVIILTRTLFEKPPVGVIKAQPNPGAVGQEIFLDASSSYHVDPAKQIVQYLWDFDASDGVDFDHPDATGPTASAYYGALGDYQVSLKVVDDSTPERFDTATLTIRITIPPHPPTAVVGGPYLGAVGEEILVDGSGSYDIDEADGDRIIAWDWESDFTAPYDFDEASGVTAYLPAFGAPGRYDIALRVTDDTETVFPQSGQSNLTHTAYGEVHIYTLGVEDLAARPKGTKCQLTWTHVGASAYKILRSETGPNQGFEQIGTTASTYSTFLDYNLAAGTGLDVNRCLGDLDNDGDVDGGDQALFNDLVASMDLDADLNGDGVVDTDDVEFFAAEYGRSDCFSDNGIELNKDYWYRVMAEVGGETVISAPVYVNSRGRITNLPPVIQSDPVTEATEAQGYEYVVDAYDPEGRDVTFLLDLGPSGMAIDAADGRITWTPSRDQVGVHDVMVRVRDGDGISATQFFQILVSPRPNTAPVVDPGQPYEDQLIHEAVSFSGSATDPEGDPIVEYRWVFGDGGEALGRTVSHVYTAPGRYTVTLYATDDRGAVGHGETYCQVGLPNRPPIANAGGPYEVEVNQPVTLDASQSYDPDADELIFTWNFGDSTPSATGMQATHTYTAVGTYQASLSVDDGRGGLDTSEVEVVVTPPNQAPSARFTVSGQAVSLETMTFDGRGSSDPDGSIAYYAWDFGDGTATTGSWVTHAFPSAGTHQVTLTVTDNKGAGDSTTQQVTVSQNQAPSAVLNLSGNLVENRPIDFSAAGSTDPEGGPLSYVWDFGDGATAEGLEVEHTYAAQGDYTVTLTVTDHVGLSTQVARDLSIASSQGPVAVFSASGPMAEGEPVSFDGSGSYDQSPGGSVVSYAWDFGDGNTAAGAVVTYTYAAAGRYEVRLTVTDNDGNPCTAMASLDIGPNQPPVALMGYSGVMATGQNLAFNGLSSYDPEGHALSYQWDFGDGHTASAPEAVHAFSAEGDFTVSLTVTDDKGQSDTTTRMIHVISPTAIPLAHIAVSGEHVVGETLVFDGGGSTAPAGRSIVSYEWDFGDGQSATGVQASHTYDQAGQYDASLRVTDDEGASSVAHLYVRIFATANHDPCLSVTYQSQGVTGKDVRFTASGTDPDGDLLTYTWDFGDGQTGVGAAVSHSYNTTGLYNVSVTASDGRGGEASLVFQVEIVAAPVSNVAPVAVPGGPYQGRIGEEISMDGSFSYDLNGDSLSYSWDFDAADGIGEDAVGAAVNHVYSDAGTYTVTLTVSDGQETGQAQAQVLVVDPADTTPPQVMIDAPAMDAVITEPTNIAGTVDDTDLVTWTLEYRETGSDDFIPFASGDSAVTSGILGKFDPTLLMNGFYVIRLSATDANGHTSRYSITVQVTGKLKVGLFTMSFKDLSIPLTGIPIEVIRTYDSRTRGKKGEFGYGWSLSVKSYPRLSKSTAEGYGWPLQNMGGLGGLYTYCIQPARAHAVTVEFPDGRTFEFDFTPTPSCQAVVPLQATRASYTPRPGTSGKLEAIGDQDLLVIDGFLYTYDMQLYDPSKFKLTLEDGTVYWIDKDAGVEKVEDPNGNSIVFSHDGITHSSGESIAFTRDGFDRITAITDPAGNSITYEYDAEGDLVSVTDRTGNLTAFEYASGGSHYLSAIHDPSGNVAQRNEYDGEGRLVATIDGAGNRIEFTHDIDSRQEVTRDRRGHVTVREYDSRGNITARIDALGHRWEYTYDSFGNRLTETDPLGHTKRTVYDDKGHVIREIDALGNVLRENTYNDQGLITEMKDALGNAIKAEYDLRGNVVRVENQMGGVELNTYDTAGRLTSRTDPLGYTTSYEYDGKGRKTKIIDPYGRVTNFTYDALGNKTSKVCTRTTEEGTVSMTWQWSYDASSRLIAEVFPDGSIRRIQYNRIGKKAVIIDRDGSVTNFHYDLLGRIVRVERPGGRVDEYLYDEEGNRVYEKCHSCSGFGEIRYEYDALNRRTKTIYPDGSETRVVYDEAGRIIQTFNENGYSTSNVYDDAGRLVKVVDALGNETRYEYDAAGRRIALIDALGHKVQTLFNSASIPVKTVFPDGTATENEVDLLGRKVSETDQAGRKTCYEYDAFGRVTRVIDALGNQVVYRYDEMGNKVEQIDANGHRTRWVYDSNGNVVQRVLPLGMSETFVYDSMGRMSSRTDFNGNRTLYSYDMAGRLIEKRFPDGSTVSYTYTESGKRSSVTDGSGTISYLYDARDRLIRETKPDGSTLEYTYDAVGNRTSITESGRTIHYDYDALNRLVRVWVADGSGRETRYEYDAVGNRTVVTHENGVQTTYNYDSLNRLRSMESRRPDGSVISSYTYTLGPSGNRLAVLEHSGRSVVYGYDALYRLTREEISDPSHGNHVITYSYDAVGNRLTKTDQTGTTVYEYDDNDRLISETGPGLAFTYGYDANGNRIWKSDAITVSSNTFDYEDRLISAEGGQVLYRYDPDGLRIEKRSQGIVTKYVYDRNRKHPRVLREENEVGDPVAVFTWGDTLNPLSMARGGGVSYYLSDGNLNVRTLVNGSGDVTDSYDLDAFGNVLHRSGTTENPYLLHGQHFDANVGYYYMRARWMDPRAGVFLSLDPVPGSIFEPQDLHRYVFTRNNPLRYRDPSGLNSGLTELQVALIINTTLETALLALDIANPKKRAEITWKSILYRYAKSTLLTFVGFGIGKLANAEFLSMGAEAGVNVAAFIMKVFAVLVTGVIAMIVCTAESGLSGSPGGTSGFKNCVKDALITMAILSFYTFGGERVELMKNTVKTFFATMNTSGLNRASAVAGPLLGEVLEGAAQEFWKDMANGGENAKTVVNLLDEVNGDPHDLPDLSTVPPLGF